MPKRKFQRRKFSRKRRKRRSWSGRKGMGKSSRSSRRQGGFTRKVLKNLTELNEHIQEDVFRLECAINSTLITPMPIVGNSFTVASTTGVGNCMMYDADTMAMLFGIYIGGLTGNLASTTAYPVLSYKAPIRLFTVGAKYTVNFSTAAYTNTSMRIYVCRCRQDIWNTANLFTSLPTVVSGSAGDDLTGNVTIVGNALQVTNLGESVSLYDFPLFCHHFKIVKCKRYRFKPPMGFMTGKLVFNDKRTRRWCSEDYVTQNALICKRGQLVLFYQLFGDMADTVATVGDVHARASSVSTGASASIGNNFCAVNFKVTQEVHWSWLSSNRTYRTVQYSGLATTGVLANVAANEEDVSGIQ